MSDTNNKNETTPSITNDGKEKGNVNSINNAKKEAQTTSLKSLLDEKARRKTAEKELKALQDAQTEAQNTALLEQKKFEELYNTAKAENDTLQATITQKDLDISNGLKKSKIISEAVKLGARNPSDVIPFINVKDMDAEAGDFAGAVKKVYDEKSYLFNTGEKGKSPLNDKGFGKTTKDFNAEEVGKKLASEGMSSNFGN